MVTHGNDDICVQETIQEYDFDKDGKLNTAEYHQVLQQMCFLSCYFDDSWQQVMEQVRSQNMVGG